MSLHAVATRAVLAWLVLAPAGWSTSIVIANGIKRAAAVTLHCVGPQNLAVPCGTVSQPIVVAPVAGGATAANQTSEITAQQAVSQTLGSQADAAYAGGSGSMISLLKGLTTSLAAGTPAIPAGGQPVSRSVGLVAGQTTQLFPVNVIRRYLAFQVPAGSGIWVNFLGGPASVNGTDCVLLPAGTMYESGPYVVRGSVSVYAPVAASISAWEG